MGRKDEWLLLARAHLGHDLHDVGNDVACLLQNDGIADANVETPYLVLVMKGRTRNL